MEMYVFILLEQVTNIICEIIRTDRMPLELNCRPFVTGLNDFLGNGKRDKNAEVNVEKRFANRRSGNL